MEYKEHERKIKYKNKNAIVYIKIYHGDTI